VLLFLGLFLSVFCSSSFVSVSIDPVLASYKPKGDSDSIVSFDESMEISVTIITFKQEREMKGTIS
jgi:hypothetical protein